MNTSSRASEGHYPNFSLDSYLKSQGIFFRTHDGEDHVEYSLNCPMCKERGEERNDTRSRLYVNSKIGRFNCKNCDWSGRLPYLVRTFSKCDLKKAISILNGRVHSDIEMLNFQLASIENPFDKEKENDSLEEIRLPSGFIKFKELRRPGDFHRYIESRGIPLSLAMEKGWGYAKNGYLANRIIVPTYMDGKLRFWQARDILGKKHPNYGNKNLYKKVLNPKGVSASKLLYNLDTAKNHGEIILCEGFLDAEKAGDNAVATFGKILHDAQLELLLKTEASSIVLLWDYDAYEDGSVKKGRVVPSSIDKATSKLRSFFRVRHIRLPKEKDAGDYEIGELDNIIM